MKILAAADIHGRYDIYRWLMERARESHVEFILLAGDLLGYPRGYKTVQEAQRHDAKEILGILAESDVPVYYIMGNDDLVELPVGSEKLSSVHGRRVELSGVNLVGYQYSLPFMGGIFEKPESEIQADLGKLADLVDERTIFLTHSPAFGVLDLGVLDNHAGSPAILELVETRRVLAHIHGHIHNCFGRFERHFNVASGGEQRAMVIDPETLVATVERGGVLRG